MGNMNIGHDPVIVTNAGNTLILRCTRMYRCELTNGVSISNDQLGWLAAILHILWWTANRRKMCKIIFLTNSGMALYHGVRAYLATSTNFDMWPDNGIWSNLDIAGKLSLAIYHCRCMNPSHHAPFVRTAQVIFASAAISPSTVACTANL